MVVSWEREAEILLDVKIAVTGLESFFVYLNVLLPSDHFQTALDIPHERVPTRLPR